jgi:hypothetical protein
MDKKKLIEIIIILFLALCPLLWFKSGFLITSVDVDWPISAQKRLIERSYVWYDQLLAGTDRSINTASLPWTAIPAFFEWMGVGTITGEKLCFIFWLALVGLSMLFLVNQVLPGDKTWMIVARVLSATVYMFNFYIFFVWVRLQLGLAALILFPILLGLFISRQNNRLSYSTSALIFLPTTVLSASIGIQPPLIVSIAIAISLYIAFYSFMNVKKDKICDFETLKDLSCYSIFIVTLFLLGSAFWALPLTNFIMQSSYTSSEVGIKVFEVEQLLNWVSNYTDIINVLSNLGDFAYHDKWGGEYYYPVFKQYRENPVLIIGKLVIPFLAFTAIFLYKNKLTLYFAVLSLVGIFFSLGTHFPNGFIFLWIINHIPGFWIYRAPWQKFAFLYTVGFSVLFGLACGKIYHYLEKRK